MMNIFKRKTPELSAPITDLKNYRLFGDEMEVLGSRLDAARNSLSRAQNDWARWYWAETVDQLMLQWRSLPILHDADAKMTQLPRWTIDYEFFETDHYNFNYGIDDKLFDKLFRDTNLDATWERVRDERLQKCQC